MEGIEKESTWLPAIHRRTLRVRRHGHTHGALPSLARSHDPRGATWTRGTGGRQEDGRETRWPQGLDSTRAEASEWTHARIGRVGIRRRA